MAEVILRNIVKKFGDLVAVNNLNLTIRNEEFLVLLGPSGCGKTTTLRSISGLEVPTSGTIYLDGVDVTKKRASQRDIAFVFQLYTLYLGGGGSIRGIRHGPCSLFRPRNEVENRVRRP